jgi:hypothetical protein
MRPISSSEETMNRFLALLTLAAATTVVAGTLAATQLHASNHHGSMNAPVAAGSACPDPAHCPFGSCPVGSSQASTVGSTPVAEQGADCSNPAACASSCPRSSASTTAAVAAK